jgi:hypothetical protein
MMNDLRDYDDAEVETLPRVDDVFVSSSRLGASQAPLSAAPKPPSKPAPTPKPAPAPAPGPAKGPGGADSTRGRSAVKAPGGHDSARARDGG